MLKPVILSLQQMHQSGKCYGMLTPKSILVKVPMQEMVKECIIFILQEKELDVRGFDTSQVTYMSNMFKECSGRILGEEKFNC